MDHHVQDMARVGARWWTEYLRQGKVPLLITEGGWGGEDRDSEVRGKVGDLLTRALLQDTPRISEEQMQLFEDKLVEEICKDWKKYGGEDRAFIFGTDYQPDSTLWNAVCAAGLDKSKHFDMRFPYKTRMRIGIEYVTVACGYRALAEYLYATKREILKTLIEEWQWGYFEQARNEEEAIIEPLLKARDAIAEPHREKAWHLIQRVEGYLEASNAVINAMKPLRNRERHMREVMHKLFLAIGPNPLGKFGVLFEEIRLALTTEDAAFLVDQKVSSSVMFEKENSL
jgi:hypothetical protein